MLREAGRAAAAPAAPPPITTTSTSLSASSAPSTMQYELVIHPHQIKPVRRRDLAAGGAVARGERRGEIVARSICLRRHESSEPTIERTWCCRNERAAAVMRISSPSRATSRRSSVLTGDLAWHSVARKVVKSCLPSRSCAAVMHRRCVERARHPPGAVLVERQIGAAIDDAVEIMPLDRREARVEICRGAFGGEHRDRLRPQMKVDRVAHRVGVPVLGEIDMRDLAERMHAGIGAAGAGDGDALAVESLRRRRSVRPAPRRHSPAPASPHKACRHIR